MALVPPLSLATGQEQPREMAVSVTIGPEGMAAGGSQLTISCNKSPGRELRAAPPKAATPGMTVGLPVPSV